MRTGHILTSCKPLEIPTSRIKTGSVVCLCFPHLLGYRSPSPYTLRCRRDVKLHETTKCLCNTPVSPSVRWMEGIYIYIYIYIYVYAIREHPFMRMSPWWSLCTLYSSHAMWSYRRWLGSLLLWLAFNEKCDVNCSSGITSHCLLILKLHGKGPS